ncbi:Neurexin-4, partial [Armadillidium nasatum]
LKDISVEYFKLNTLVCIKIFICFCLSSMKAKSRICSTGMRCEDTITNRKTCNNGKTASTITFNGFNYLSYRLYFGENRIQTFSNEFSFSFKTLFKDAILFYISGEISMTSKRSQHLSISLTEEERLFVSLDSGAELISIVFGDRLCDNQWHDVIVRHKKNKIQLILDGNSEIRELLTNDKFFFEFDPLVFVGGFPNLVKDCAIRPRNISSIYKNCEEMSQKYVYNVKDESCENITVYNCEDQDKTEVKIFDDEDECLETCHVKGKTQMLQADCDCNMEEESLVSFLTYDSYLNLYRDSSNESFSITFKVKSKGGNILQGLVYSQNGVYPWKLKFEEQRMILTLSTPDKVYLVAPQNMDKKDWLEVVLTLDGKNLALVVNDQRDSMSLDSNITIDDKLTFTGFVGCLKAIVLDGNPQDLRSYIGTSVSRDVVGGCQKTLLATAEDCPTGSFCSVQSTFDCEKEIYEGNCHLEVFCEFHKNGYTFTIVDHNIPQRFTNVKNKAKYFLVNVQYREFTAEGLRYLISTSEECYQDVKISCGDMTTFYKQVSFSSAFLAGIDHLGDRHFGVCHCTGFEDCYQSTSQNSTNKNGYRIVNQTALPILQLKIQREDSDDAPYSEPHLSLGKLYCKNNENSLLIHYGMPSKSQSVTFTTSYPMNEGQWNALWIDVVQNSFRIIFNDQIKFSNFNNENVMHLMDGFFILGNIPKEYRNDKDKDIDNGLIGCYSPIRLNNKALNTSELISNSYKSQEISLGCKGACDENPCQNGATCLEKWTSYECSCVNPFAHLGINCENTGKSSLSAPFLFFIFRTADFTSSRILNTNAVTLFSSTEAVYYNSGFVDESASPLTSNFTFNIKTNEPNCILFVAMDYLQNIIQIHLENSTIIRLLLNFGDELAELKIDTREYSLNKGQSLQIVVERFQNRTDLLVFTQNQTFSSTLDRGITLITEEDYKQYPYEVQNQLIQYQHSFTVPEKFSLVGLSYFLLCFSCRLNIN